MKTMGRDTNQPVTLAVIAETAGVSKGAASQILSNPQHRRFAEATRERVLEAAARLRYRPNHAAKSLRLGQSKLIGLVTPWNVPELLDSLEMQTRNRGYRTMLQFTYRRDREAEREAILSAADRRVDGMLWLPAFPEEDYGDVLEMMRTCRIETVFLEWPLRSISETFDHSLVETDLLHRLTKTLALYDERHFTEIIFLASHRFHAIHGSKAEEFEEFLRNHQLPAKFLHEKREQSPADRARAVLQCSGLGRRPLIVCTSEWTAVRLVDEAIQAGRSIPAELGIISIGDFLIGGDFRPGEVTRPTLSALRRPYADLARVAVDLLIERIESEDSDRSAVVQSVSTEWIPRESCPAPEDLPSLASKVS
jgi:LacI family transcriptional regulator